MNLRRVVTPGSPHRGTKLAHLWPGFNARQMEPGSPWLRELNQAPLPVQLDLVSLYSLYDNIILPQDNAAYPGARLEQLCGLGHVTLLRHPEVALLRHPGAAL